MAIDTAAKRRSSLDFEEPGEALPLPDGTISQGDRQHSLGSYSGILAAVVVASTRPATRLLPHGIPGAFFGSEGGVSLTFDPMVLEWVGEAFTFTAGDLVAFDPMVLEWVGETSAVTGPLYLHVDPMILEWDGGSGTGPGSGGGFTISGQSPVLPPPPWTIPEAGGAGTVRVVRRRRRW